MPQAQTRRFHDSGSDDEDASTIAYILLIISPGLLGLH